MTRSPAVNGEFVKSGILAESDIKAFFYTENVFLFVPNIIDYLRIILLGFFVLFSLDDAYQLAALCYIFSVALDEVDGNSARYLNQTSIYGMILDIIIDEVTVLCICTLLGTIYPQYIVFFQFVTVVDIAAQWSNYQHAAMFKANDYTRKDNWILNIYFNRKVFTNLWVYGNHVFLLMLYLCAFTSGAPFGLFGYSIGIWKLVACLSAPWSISRSLLMVYLFILSMSDIASQDRVIHRLERHRQRQRQQNGVIPCSNGHAHQNSLDLIHRAS